MTEHSTLLLGAYVLDALDTDQRREIEDHLLRCPRCAADLAELAPLPTLLGTLTEHHVAALDWAAPAPPPADLFERLCAAAAPHPAPMPLTPMPLTPTPLTPTPLTPTHPWRRPRTLVAAAAAVVLLGGGIGGWIAASGADGPRTSYAASTGAVHMQVRLEEAKTGTTLRVEVAGLPTDEHCTLVAVARDGSRHTAGQWVATYAGTATVTGSTDVATAQLRQLVLLGTDGRQLVGIEL